MVRQSEWAGRAGPDDGGSPSWMPEGLVRRVRAGRRPHGGHTAGCAARVTARTRRTRGTGAGSTAGPVPRGHAGSRCRPASERWNALTRTSPRTQAPRPYTRNDQDRPRTEQTDRTTAGRSPTPEDKRVATINRIATAIGRTATKPQGVDSLTPCTLTK